MRKYISILVLLCGVWGGFVKGATFTSNGTSGDWNNPLIWSIIGEDADGIPDADDNVIIANSDFVMITEDAEAYSLTIGTSNGTAFSGIVILDQVELSVIGDCYIYSGGALGFPSYQTYVKRIYIGNPEQTGSESKLIVGGNITIAATSNSYAGIDIVGEAELELKGSIILLNDKGFLNAQEVGTVTLSGLGSQQIYMGYGTGIEYPNLVIEGHSVTVVASSPLATGVGLVKGDLIVKNGIFNNGGRKIDVGQDIVVEQGAFFYLSGGNTITVNNETKFTLDGTLITEHVNGLAGVSPLEGIDFGDNAVVEFAGSLVQKTGFADFGLIEVYPKLVFSNSNITSLDDSIVVKDIEIKNGATFNGNGHNYDIIVTNSWLNNGTFAGNTSTVRFEQNVTSLQGAGVNNFRHLTLGQDVHITDPVSLTINGNLTLEEGSSLVGDESITVVGNIGVGPGAEFTAPETLTVGGSLLVDPSGIFDNGHGTYGRVVFNGLVGIRQTSGVRLFKDVTISSPINFAGNDTINGELYIQGGGLSSISGNLVLNLDKGYVHYLSNGGFGGDSVVFIKKTSHNGYSYLSFPVQTTVGNLKSMGFNHVFRYNENDINLPMYVEEKNNSTLIEPDGKGYACRANFSEPLIKLKAPFNITPANKTVTLYSTNGSNGQPDPSRTSWNLIGNPYPFDLDWDELQSHYTNSVFSSYYISSGDQFIPYVDRVPAGGGRISAMQAVMVYLRRTGSSYSAPFELRKSASLPTHSEYSRLYRKAPIYNVLKLAVSNGKYTDATYVRLTDEATLDFDENKDAFKLKNSGKVPSFYSYLKGVHYAINSVPETFDKFVMPLAFEAKESGTYTITLSEEYPYDLPYELYLEDKVLNVLHPIGSERTYTFTTNLNESPPRFALHFENPVITALEGLEVRFARVFAEGREITVHGYMESPAEISVFDISGRLVVRHSGVDLNNKSFNFKAGNSAGMYIVSVVSGDNTHSERVVLY